jgi:isopenicillin-N N-acyltransferase-like protein
MFESLSLSGPPRERGRAYGEALADKIHGHLAAWSATLGDAPEAWLRDLVRDTDFMPAIRAWAPDLLEEVEGIAEGAGQPPERVYALQLLDEEWAYRVRRTGGQPPAKCSSFGVATADLCWIGQNMDLGGYTDGFQALLRIAPHGHDPGALVFTTAGMLGLMGVNDAGLGVCVNSLPQLASRATGVPVAFVLRRLLRSASFAEAVTVVETIPHATNQHYVLAAAHHLRSFEASADGVVEYRPPDHTRVLHTNHPLEATATEPEPEALRANSHSRLKSLEGRLGEGRIDLEVFQAALSACDDPAHPVCRLRDEKALAIGFTTGAIISRLAPGSVESWVSPGPPTERGWTHHTLTRASASGAPSGGRRPPAPSSNRDADEGY